MLQISNARFAFLDIETTGLSPWFGDRICRVAIILAEGKRIRAIFDLPINPEAEISPAAMYLNKVDESALLNAPVFAESADKIQSALRDSIIVCHNSKFDIQFLDNEYRKLGRVVEYPNLIDTMLVAREYFDLPSYGLSYLAELFNAPYHVEGSRAQANALALKNVFFAMMDALKPNHKPLEDYIGIYSSPAWPPEGVYLPVELSEAIHSGKPMFIKYMDKHGEVSERWITPNEVLGLSDYIYLKAYCHTRQAERTFRLDRILEIRYKE